MSIFDKLIQPLEDQAIKELNTLLLDGETLEEHIQLVNDYFAFTSRRVIFVDKHPTSSRRTITSIPYSKISEVTVVSGGLLSLSNEIAIQVGNIRHEVRTHDKNKSILLYKRLVAKIS